MIKYAGKMPDGKRLLGLGLSRENCNRLLAGQPIRIEVNKLIPGINIVIDIIGGETEAAMYDQLKDNIGPETILHGVGPEEGE